jgi:Ca2+-binding RTX toxin-like protein
MSGDARGGADRLYGDAGADRLYGDAFLLEERARGGDDVLSGGAGNDRLWGDGEAASDAAEVVGGADRFVFGSGSDRDTVLDFEDNKDVIDVRGFRGIDRFAEVRAWATQADADTVIDLGAASGAAAHADVLTLAGFDLTRLNAADFVFA